MNNEDIIRYCTTSPENVNPAVLKSMLDGIEGGGGGGDEDESTGGVVIINAVLAERPASVYGEYDLVFRIEKSYSEILSILEEGKMPVIHTPAVEDSYDWKSEGFLTVARFAIEEPPTTYKIEAGPLSFFS